MTLSETRSAPEVRRIEKLGIKSRRFLEFCLCVGVILAQGKSQAARHVRFGEIGREAKRRVARGFCLLEIGLPRVEHHVEERATIGNPGVCERVVRVYFNRSLEHLPRILQALAAELEE